MLGGPSNKSTKVEVEMNNPFPVRIHCSDKYGWADCPKLAKALWLRLRPELAPNLIWYGADMEILSPTSVKLFIYEMEDTFYGGIGKKIFETVVTDFTPVEKAMLERDVMNIYNRVAEDEYERREEVKRKLVINQIRREMFGD
jgi:hypothetical protein